ncbi:zinc finger protein 831 [Rhea pennata]|uniref:zinc finger protein 831 n=1 Tax=Rhea pennata TaxID=8795 RepID=UPI002E2568E7
MEAQKHSCFTAALADQPDPTSSLQPAQGSSGLSQSSATPQREQALAQPVYLKALTIPLYQPVQPGCFQPNSQSVTGRGCVNLDSSNIPLILNPLVPSEGTYQPQSVFQKQLGQTLTLNIVSTLPVLLSPNSCANASFGNPGKSKNAGKYICKHCGRDCLKPSVLEKHIRSHTGERPFPCTTCGIAFKTQSNLYKHRRTQTHVNNTRLPSDSENSGILEQNESAAESVTSHQGTKLHSSAREDEGVQIKQGNSETSVVKDTKTLFKDLPLPATKDSFASENQIRTNPSFSSKINQEVPEEESLPSPVALPYDEPQRKKIQEQRTPAANKHIQLQRQQATYSDKQWDYKPFDCKLKKCESTDSGYLSRSDSTEQQMPSPSPLHSLSEHSTELESETAFSSLRCTAGSSAKLDSAEKATALMLEKKRLEEHISKLISHNKSVVDDTQLDNVRPRKTVLSKQGSIDLPMPYTYKDSFHFDIRTFDVNRRKNLSLCSAKSTFAPLEKCKPLFFHSVPTQFSTTIDSVPVTRSNSLPFVVGTRTVHDKAGCSNPLSLTKQSVNTSSSSLLPSNNLAANSIDFPNSHPRALVRQTAVDDLPLSNAADSPSPAEELQGSKKLGAGEVVSAKNKKQNQKKLKMFSEEKWQMYGDETFKKIYQKMKSSQNAKKMKQRGNKITDITGFTPNSKESVSSAEIIQERDSRSSLSDRLSSLGTADLNTVKSESCPNGNHVLQNASSEEAAGSLTYVTETSHSVNARAHTIMSKSSQNLRGSDTDKNTSVNNTLRVLSSCELRLQNTPCQPNSSVMNDDCLPVQSSNWEDSKESEKKSSPSESECKNTSNDYGNHHRKKETGQHALTSLWVHCNSNREASGKSQNLPSERKKLKVDVERKENITLKSCSGPTSETNAEDEREGVSCSTAQCLCTAPMKPSGKAKEQKLSTSEGAERAECVKTIRLPTKPLNYSDGNLSHSAGISAASVVGFLGPELTGSDCNSFAFHDATDKDVKTCLVKTKGKVPLFSDNVVDISAKIHHLQSGQLTPVPQKNAFSPKYILKLPQGKRSSDLSLLLRSEQKITPSTSVTDTTTSPSCSSSSRSLSSDSNAVAWSPLKFEVRQKACRGELRWNVHANWKTPAFCSPVNSETTSILTTVDNTFYNQNFRQKEMIKDAWKNKYNKNKLNYQRQTEDKWMNTTTSSAQMPMKKICFTSMYTSGFFISADIKEEKSILHHLCSGSNSLEMTSGQSCPVTPEQTILGWGTDGNPCIRKDISPALQGMEHSQSSTDNSTYFCHSFGTCYCHTLTTHCKEFPALPHNSLTCCSGSLTVLSTKNTFPSLSAEPRLTWCCLTRSLPLPAEQKGNADSAYSSMHICDKESSNECTLSKYDISFFKMKNISKTVAYGLTNRSLKTLVSSFSKGPQMQELSSAAPGGAFANISEQKKKTVVCKRERITTNKLKRSHKQKKIKVTSKWYRRRHAHGYALLKINRLSKQHCFPHRPLDDLKKGYPSQTYKFNQLKKCLSPQSKLQGGFLHQQKEASCSTSDKPLCRRKKEEKNNSGILSHTEKLTRVKRKDEMDKNDISGQIREHTRTKFSFQNITPPLEISVTAHSFSSTVNTAMQQVSNDIEICCLVTQPLVLQRSVPGESQPNVRTGSVASSFWSCPFDFPNTGTDSQIDSTSSETTDPVSLCPEATQGNILKVESERQRFGELDMVMEASGREKCPTEEIRSSSPEENSTASSQPGCSHTLGSKAESLLESTTRANLPNIEYTEWANFSQKILHGNMDKNETYLQSGNYGRQHETNTAAFKEPSITLRFPEFKTYSATSSKTYKKKGLEIMRKQNRVEYDDTSSDDEDRLVIEI